MRETEHAVVHYSEIGLKGANRPFFERTLARNILRRLEAMGGKGRTERLSGRILVHLEAPWSPQQWAEALSPVFGIAHFAPAYITPLDMAAIQEAILENLPSGPVSSFRISASRDNKAFPLTSPEIQRELGAAVQQKTGWPVRLKGAELDIGVEILRDRAVVYLGRMEGPGGLPVGTSGKVVLLLSGGIDSPVAGYFALKRGCRVIPVHFHSRPFGNWMGSESRAREIVRTLTRYGMEPYLYVVPIGKQQREITVRAPVAYRVILYRRLMVRVATRIARQEGAKAIFTGESLGQVASQTLESLAAVEDAAGLPVLRPLIGLDKLEIIAIAERIGTFPLSLMEGDDCCQFLMPRRVVTHPRLEDVLRAESAVDMEVLAQDALEGAIRVEV